MQTFLGFWESLPRPIIGLSPMDGVTDFACRYIIARYGRPDVMFTEFTTVEGLFHAPERILKDFEYHEIERPIVAQIYGHTPENFYKAAQIVCELGFDGIDINMGCPAKSVVQRNAGAKLITAPDLALKIIRAVKQGIRDWACGQRIEDLALSEAIPAIVRKMNRHRTGVDAHGQARGTFNCNALRAKKGGIHPRASARYSAGLLERHLPSEQSEREGEAPPPLAEEGATQAPRIEAPAPRRMIPYSVKTRIGYNSVVIEKWVETLLQESPAVISIHGRTLKQMYQGRADWDAIARAAAIIHRTKTLVLGNGDIADMEEAKRRIETAGVDGVLIGRSAIGNPWIFTGQSADRTRRMTTALEHIRYFREIRGGERHASLNKHLLAYLKHFPDAASLRTRAAQTKSLEEVEALLKDF